MEGWVIPRGNPKADLARRFVKFCANAKRQAEFTPHLAYGPTNPNAYKFIAGGTRPSSCRPRPTI